MATTLNPGLLAAVLADPGDDMPRLILADYLDEHGDPARAEFIRVQCRLAEHAAYYRASHQSTPGDRGEWFHTNNDWCDCESCRLRRREYQLFAGPEVSRFLTPEFDADLTIADGVGRNRRRDRPLAVLRRGFVESVTCACEDWRAHGPAVVKCQPVTRVTLAGKRPVELPEGWCWMPVYGDGDAGQIPWEMAEHLPGRHACWVAGGVLYYRVGATEQAALDALSAATPAWAKAAALLTIR